MRNVLECCTADWAATAHLHADATFKFQDHHTKG